MSETALILLFWGAVLGGVALGGAIGWWRGTMWGVATGCLIIGLGASVAAGTLAWQRAQFIAQSTLVQGRLVGYPDGPLVEFETADRATRSVRGLGGSQGGLQPGEAVPVRFIAADPASAIVADFQNLWGGVLAFTIFGALPLVFGLFFLGVARQEQGESRRGTRRVEKAIAPELSPLRRRMAGQFTVAGNIVMLAGMVAAFVADDTLFQFGRAFLVIGIGATLFALAFWLKREGDWQAPAICLIVALGFVLFGGGAMLIGGH